MVDLDPISVPEPGHLPPRRDSGAFDFLDASRESHADLSIPLGGVPRALREAADLAGLDPLTSLYNEALRYAQEGHLRLARERLQMLLCMAPDDGEARLMLARVLLAGQRWSDALAALDEAASCAVDVPMSLRRAVEDHLRAERAAIQDNAGGPKGREHTEIKTLRLETRRLRSDNAQQSCQIAELEREVRKWAWATAGVSALTIVFIAGSLALGRQVGADDVEHGSAVPVGPVVGGPAPTIAPIAAPLAAPVPADPAPDHAPEPTDGADQLPPPVVEVVDLPVAVADAIAKVPGVSASDLTVRIDGDRVIVEGEVTTHKQRRAIERAVAAIDGVHAVDARSVTLSARTRGATHTVERGDTLSHLAWAYYGDPSMMRTLAEANGGADRLLKIGETLVVPPVDPR